MPGGSLRLEPVVVRLRLHFCIARLQGVIRLVLHGMLLLGTVFAGIIHD